MSNVSLQKIKTLLKPSNENYLTMLYTFISTSHFKIKRTKGHTQIKFINEISPK